MHLPLGQVQPAQETVTASTTWFYNYDRNGNRIWKNATDYNYNYQLNVFHQLTMILSNSETVGQ